MASLQSYKDNNKIEQIIEKGLVEQKKTIDSIFGFAKCMIDLKSECNKIQGGSEFSKIASERWNISQSSCRQWLAIGLNETKLVTIGNDFLPDSYRTIYEMTTLSNENLKSLNLKSKPTRQYIIDYKNKLKQKEINKQNNKKQKETVKNFTEIMDECSYQEQNEFDNKLRESLKRSQEKIDKSRNNEIKVSMSEKQALKIFGLYQYPIDKIIIRFIYNGYSKIYHPDKGGNEEKMKMLNIAYGVLK